MKHLLYCILLFTAALSHSASGVNPTAECHAAFDVSVDPANPMKIRFVDRSTGQIALWQWSFGDGQTATGQNQEHVYTSGGTYFVCLTVSNSQTGFICHDVLCMAITVHEPGKCIADYNYTIDNQNDLMLHFTDSSSGSVNNWNWNFGDGAVSGAQNPVHQFPAYGTYLVCLTAYNPDSLSICQNTKCDSIVLTPSHHCKADFSWQLDSMNTEPNTFLFTDKSLGNPTSRVWTFSDGAVYTSGNVVHRFQSAGSFEVCLKIFREEQGTILCTDSVCQEMTTAIYFSLGGHLFTGSRPINNPVSTGDTGIICLYREVDSGLLPVDTLEFTHLGYFAFPALLKGEYVARARLTSGSAGFNNFFPTYFPGKLSWTDSCGFLLKDSSRYAAHIHMLQSADMVSGPCTLSGTVVQTWNITLPAELPRADIMLFNIDMVPVRFTVSESDGTFLLAGIPFGLYYVRVEVPGFHSRTTAVWLDKSTTQISDLVLEVFNHDVTGIDISGKINRLNCSLFPNPSEGDVYLDIETNTQEPVLIESYTSVGVKISEFSLICAESRNRIMLPDLYTADRLYFIRVLTADRRYSTVLKLIRL